MITTVSYTHLRAEENVRTVKEVRSEQSILGISCDREWGKALNINMKNYTKYGIIKTPWSKCKKQF